MMVASSSSGLTPAADATDAPSRSWRHSGAWIGFFTLAVYVLLPTKEFYWDGVGFAQAIEAPRISPSLLFYPNHLVYNLMGYVVWKALAAAGIAVRALYVLQALNALFAAASVYALWQTVTELSGSARRGACCAMLFAFSATWWRFSTDADAYIPSVFFLILCFRLMLPARRLRPFTVGLAHGAAMLFHQLAVFFFPVALCGFLFRPPGRDGAPWPRHRGIQACQYALTAILLTGIAYVGGFWMAQPDRSVSKFWNWLTVHADDAAFSFNVMHNLGLTLRGTLRLFFGGRVTQVQPGPVTVAGALAGCAILVLFVRYCARSKRMPAPAPGAHAQVRLTRWLSANRLPLIWILSYVAFLFFWLPQNTFYRLFYLPPLILLLAAAPLWRADRIRLMALLPAAACVWNFTVAIYPRSRTETNEVLAFALQHRNDWQPGTAIVYRTYHADLWTISYFNPQARWIAMPSAGVDQAEKYRHDEADERQALWLEGTAYDALAAAGGQAWLDRHVDRARSFLYTSPSHKIRFYRVE